MGNDTLIYHHLFKDIVYTTDIRRFAAGSRYESGFLYLSYFLRFISHDSQVLFIVTGAFVAFSFGRFFYKYSELPWMSVFMFLTLQFFDLSMSGIRQIVSISILLFSYDFIIKRKPLPFVLLVLLASSMHTSATVFFILYPLTFVKPTKKFYLTTFALGVVSSMFFKRFLIVLNRIFPQYMKYFLGKSESFKTSPTLACALMFVLFLTLFIIAEAATMNSEDNIAKAGMDTKNLNPTYIKHASSATDVLKLSIWLGIIMLLLSMHGTILNRFKYVFSSPIMVYYPNALTKIKSSVARSTMVIGSCCVFLLYILIIYKFRPQWQSTYPYSFFWQ